MTYTEYLTKCRVQYLNDCLREARGNMTQAARTAGLNRTAFYLICKRHAIDIEAIRAQFNSVKSIAIPALSKWSR